jgi:hypothetical protein
MAARSYAGLPAVDLALAAVLVLSWLGAILTDEAVEGPRRVTVPVAVLCCATVAVRSRWPLGAALVLAIAQLAQALWGWQSPHTLMALVATVVVVWSVAAESAWGGASSGLVVLLGVGMLDEWHDHTRDYLFVAVVLVGAWLVGRAARHLRQPGSRAGTETDGS